MIGNVFALDPHPTWRNAIKTTLASVAIALAVRALLDAAARAKSAEDERHSLDMTVTHEGETLADVDLWTADSELIVRALDTLSSITMRLVSPSPSTTVNNLNTSADRDARLRVVEGRLSDLTRATSRLSDSVASMLSSQQTILRKVSAPGSAAAPTVPNDYAGNEPPLVVAPGFVSEEEAALTPEAAFAEIMESPPLPSSFADLVPAPPAPTDAYPSPPEPPAPSPMPEGLSPDQQAEWLASHRWKDS